LLIARGKRSTCGNRHHTTKATSKEDKNMNAMNAALFLDLNCKNYQEKRLMLDSLLEMGQIKESVHRILSKKLK